MAIFTTLSVVIWFFTGTLGIFAEYAFFALENPCNPLMSEYLQ